MLNHGQSIQDIVAVSASPGFTWGRSGNTPNSTYLLNDTVPSNLSGRIVHLATGNITGLFVAVEDDTTCTFEIFKKTAPNTFTSLQSISLAVQRKKSQTYDPGAAVVAGDELVVQITSGSAKNPVFGCLMRGTT